MLTSLKTLSLKDLLDIAQKKFGELVFEPITVGPTTVEVLQIKDLEAYIDKLVNSSPKKIELPFWAKIWPTSIVLSLFIQRLNPNGKELLELGCGVGVCGLFAAKHGFRVTLSDINEDALLFSQINILKNKLEDKAKVEKIDFTKDDLGKRYDIILGSEILYSDKDYENIYHFLNKHIKEDGEVIIGKEQDIKAKRFFELAHQSFNILQKNISLKSEQEGYLCTIYRFLPKKHDSA